MKLNKYGYGNKEVLWNALVNIVEENPPTNYTKCYIIPSKSSGSLSRVVFTV